MIYAKGTSKKPLDDMQLSKQHINYGDKGTPDYLSEDIWIARDPSTKTYIFQNDAVMFYPYPSWGAVIPENISDLTTILKEGVITLHPDAWDKCIKMKVISTRGALLQPLRLK